MMMMNPEERNKKKQLKKEALQSLNQNIAKAVDDYVEKNLEEIKARMLANGISQENLESEIQKFKLKAQLESLDNYKKIYKEEFEMSEAKKSVPSSAAEARSPRGPGSR